MSGKIEITVLSGISSGDIFRFDLEAASDGVGIGRAPENDLVLQDPTVSRKHARIEFDGKNFMLSDNGSSHGTVHMGFPVQPGPSGARQLSSGDEFKIGDAIFRISLPKREEAPVETAATDKKPNSLERKETPSPLKSKKIIALLVAALLGLGLLLLPEEAVEPPQLGNKPMLLPQERVIGFLKDGNSKRQRDVRHKEKAMFVLPTADLLVELEYRIFSDVDVYLDESLITTLEASPDIWQYLDLIIRDPLIGTERKLIFKNKSYSKGNKKDIKPWGVRNVRATPIARNAAKDVSAQLAQTESLAISLDKTPDALFNLIRSAHRSILEAANEISQDAVPVFIDIESRFPTSVEAQQELEGILAERNATNDEVTPEARDRHIRVLADLTGRLEAELWRRVKNRFSRAIISAKSRNGLAAYDQLKAVMAMFPEESDQRWVIANRMLNNKKIVPKKIRKNPSKYRRRAS